MSTHVRSSFCIGIKNGVSGIKTRIVQSEVENGGQILTFSIPSEGPSFRSLYSKPV